MARPMLARRAATVIAVTLVSTLAVTALSGTVAAAPNEARTPPTTEQRQEAVEAAQRQAAELEKQRLRELTADGMTAEEAAETLEAEHRQVAASIRQRIIELSSRGMTIDEIAAETPGLVVVSAPDEVDAAPLSSGEDMTLKKASISFARQCNCYTVSSGWTRNRTLEAGLDVVGIRLTKRVSNNMGGSVKYCRNSSDSSCTFITQPSWEEPAGVAHSFTPARGSHHGTIAFTYRGSVGSVQPYTHYRHAWENVRITGIGISTSGISVSWEYNKNAWSKQTAGNHCSSC